MDYLLVKRLGAKARPENLLWRDVCWRAGYESAEKRAALMIACARDPLFWINTFVWILEPRPGRGKKKSKSQGKCIPFITYPCQDRAILKMIRHIREGEDLLIRKSRDMGATWICLAVFLWFWCFETDCTFTVLSAKEEMVDKDGNPKALFFKLLYALERLPDWMTPNYKKTKMHLANKWNGSVIDGEATQPNATVSDRRMALLLDEFAKVDKVKPGLGGEILGGTADVTNCRIINSTPDGHDSGYWIAHESPTAKEILHWSEHPLKNPGLYRVEENGDITVLDEAWHLRNPGYAFNYEPGGWKGLRSPWYDKEVVRRHSPIKVARELDMAFGGSGDPYFIESEIAAVKARDCRQPFSRCRAEEYLKENFDDIAEKPLSLWFIPDIHGRPDQNTTYTISVDIAQGSGASDSVISVGDDRTKALIAQYTSNRIRPDVLADLTVAFCEWFTTPLDQAFLIYDGTGPGVGYGLRIIDKHNYCRIYRYQNKASRTGNKAPIPGYPFNRELKESLFSRFATALYEGTYTTRSAGMLKQCLEYVYDGKGGVEHMNERLTDYKSGRGKQHGDKVISEALLVEGMSLRPAPPETPFRMPEHCYARREQAALDKIEEEENAIGSLGW